MPGHHAPMFTMRFDLRAPSGGAPTTDLYAAAIDMAAWAEDRGAVAAIISEHHTSPDGYLPAPLLLASAMASRTKHLPLMIGAALLPFYEPIRLAEEMVVLDIISRGRVSYVFGIGYRAEEFEMYGVDMHRRGTVAEAKLELVLAAVGGEPFVHDGRRIQVTPPPFTSGGPTISWGGGTHAAARRAGRFGLGFFAQSDIPGLQEAYEAGCAEGGHPPVACVTASPGTPTTVFVADDLDRAWDEIGSYLLHDVLSYAEWNDDSKTTASLSASKTIDALREERGAHRIFTVDEAVEHVRTAGVLSLHPLIGGMPPEIAWPYLERVVNEVLPAV
jgi:alkanesulfonate monooxygenase SsuD/methylene tetrahydromethanopterin reductase-like flavin-dependent oxidoreductase (luciferase family)